MSAVDPSRVQCVRHRAGMSVKDFAERCGVDVRSVRNWENDGAPTARVSAIARATGAREVFLLRPALEIPDDDAVFFRARRRTSRTRIKEATALSAIGADFYGAVGELLAIREPDVPADLSSPTPQDAARDLRLAWGLGTGVAPNLVQLSELHGIRVLGLPDPEEDVDAFSFWGPQGRPFILLGRAKTAERTRFDLAHELGHLVMHSGTTATTDRQLEQEANQFAAELLIPLATLRAVAPQSPSIQDVLTLKERFGVSAQAMAYALRDCGHLSEWSLRQLLSELKNRGYLTDEPGSALGMERSKVYDALAGALRARQTTTARWARDLGLSTSDVSAFTFRQLLVAA